MSSLDPVDPPLPLAAPRSEGSARSENVSAAQPERRDFLRLIGASLAAGGLHGCVKQPDERIVPYIQDPEHLVPGKPVFYASALERGGYGTGVLVETHQGRPTKIEGNPQHPYSLGATDAITQAEILNLYDPDRSQSVRHRGNLSTWKNFFAEFLPVVERLTEAQGEGLRILTRSVSSPTLGRQLAALHRVLPKMRWHQYEPLNRDAHWSGTTMALGRPLEATYRFDRARVVVALDCDLMGTHAGAVHHARHIMNPRRGGARQSEFNRIYVAESTPTVTGSAADHRLPCRADAIADLVHQLTHALGLTSSSGPAPQDPKFAAWIREVANDLRAHRGQSVISVGDAQPAAVHAAVAVINHGLANVGQTVIYREPSLVNAQSQTESLTSLVSAMNSKKVDTLVILGGNPVYDAPADLKIAQSLEHVAHRVHLGLYEDETARLSHWHLPESHPLEAWGDTRALDGTASIVQPMIEPLYPTRSVGEVLAVLGGQPNLSGYELVRQTWRQSTASAPTADFESFWRRSLHDGLIADSSAPPVNLPIPTQARDMIWRKLKSLSRPADALEVTLRPDACVWDGRYANNGWLQELPDPITKITWENTARVAPSTAKEWSVQNGDEVELNAQGVALRVPIWIVPGQARDSITLPLGYGRTQAGKLGTGAGFNAYRVRRTDALWSTPASVQKTGRKHALACTQDHHSMEGRHLVRSASWSEAKKDPDFAHTPDAHIKPLSLLSEHTYTGHQWGMTIDLGSCIGCGACTVACQAENNVAVVGKEEVKRGRELHWIRVDRYFEGSEEDPQIAHQPVTCMHCEQAPCEVVCPVNATVHGPEGLNQMVYNRCVGTRYCSNNCPYKVRRFNFYLYSDYDTPSLKLMRNPDVTVRSRGVMEKCTFCVQRISVARITAKKEGRPIRDGEVQTACQAVCPTQAISFGDVADPKSAVSQTKNQRLNYTLLNELNTKPRTSYLAKITNPNPKLNSDEQTPGEAG